MGHSTIGDSRRKKPVFPLWLHTGTGQWCKKIRGKNKYFGTDQDKALEKYTKQREDLEAGRIPREAAENELTLHDLCNLFMDDRKQRRQIGELTQRSWNDYHQTAERLIKSLGSGVVVDELHPTNLMEYRKQLVEKGWGPATIANEVQRVRVILRFAFEAGYIDRPIRFGEFKRPKKVAFRRLRTKIGPRMIEPEDLKRILAAADVQLKAMILLGLNAGFGNADCGTLPVGAVNLLTGWIEFPRPKTGIDRRVPLWPETIQAIEVVLECRRAPKEGVPTDLLFVTKYGQSWHIDDKPRSAVSAEFRKLLNTLKLYKRGRSFYTLRHIFATIGEETGDNIAIRRIMGHADGSMSDHYRERFPDDRLRRVVEHVRNWVFPPESAAATTEAKESQDAKT